MCQGRERSRQEVREGSILMRGPEMCVCVYVCVLHEAPTLERERRGIREEDGSALSEEVRASVQGHAWVCVHLKVPESSEEKTGELQS